MIFDLQLFATDVILCNEVVLSQGKVAVVDDEDLPFVNRRKWFAHRTPKPGGDVWYATRSARPPEVPKATMVYMHRELMGNPTGLQVDHENGCGLDNRRSNLRVATHGQNCHNQRKTRGVSKYKGVTFCNNPYLRLRWEAKLNKEGICVLRERFATEEEAARAYDTVAVQEFGEFARLNFPGERRGPVVSISSTDHT